MVIISASLVTSHFFSFRKDLNHSNLWIILFSTLVIFPIVLLLIHDAYICSQCHVLQAPYSVLAFVTVKLKHGMNQTCCGNVPPSLFLIFAISMKCVAPLITLNITFPSSLFIFLFLFRMGLFDKTTAA